MPLLGLEALARQCAPAVDPITVNAIVAQESAGNPHAIGVVGGELVYQPSSQAQALATARQLEAQGVNYSVGLAQINRVNFASLGLTVEEAFDPCTNLRAMQSLLHGCWQRARRTELGSGAVRGALSCYYSGTTDHLRFTSYVDAVIARARALRGTPASPPP